MATLFLALAFGLAGCGKTSTTASTYQLSGYVQDAESGTALKGASVTYTSDTLDTATATTDSSGRYEIAIDSDTPFGHVSAQKGGYQPADKTVYFDTPTRRMDLDLRPTPTM